MQFTYSELAMKYILFFHGEAVSKCLLSYLRFYCGLTNFKHLPALDFMNGYFILLLYLLK